MKKVIAIAALMVAFPALSNERDYKIENMLAGLYACYWHYSDVGNDSVANQFKKEYERMTVSYDLYLGDRHKSKYASMEIARLVSKYPEKYNMKSLCLKAHDSLIKPRL